MEFGSFRDTNDTTDLLTMTWTKSSNLTGKYPHGARDAGRRPVFFLVVLQGSFTTGRTIFLRDQVRTTLACVFSDKGIGCKTTWKLILYRFSLKGWAFFGHRAKFRVDIQSFFEVPHALMWHNLCAVGWPCQPDFETMRNQERKADSWQPWKSFKLLSSNLLHDNTKIQEDLRWVTLVLYIAWLVQGTYYILLSWIKSTNFIPKLRENEGGLFAGYWTTSVSIQLNQNQYIHI